MQAILLIVTISLVIFAFNEMVAFAFWLILKDYFEK